MMEQPALFAEQQYEGRFPLTEFIAALMKMTPQQRRAASAERAAERYGLPVARCQGYIDHFRSLL
jgi:hypothetical protein